MISRTADGIVIDVRVVPRAGRSGIAGTRDGALLVRLNAPPVAGAANAELVELLADALGVAKRDVSIASRRAFRSSFVNLTAGAANGQPVAGNVAGGSPANAARGTRTVTRKPGTV
jgi:uncharacterized protein (TIGR00251 family)